jgi:hypothetical protein
MIKKSVEMLKALFFIGRNKTINKRKKSDKPEVKVNLASSKEDWTYHYWLNFGC